MSIDLEQRQNLRMKELYSQIVKDSQEIPTWQVQQDEDFEDDIMGIISNVTSSKLSNASCHEKCYMKNVDLYSHEMECLHFIESTRQSTMRRY